MDADLRSRAIIYLQAILLRQRVSDPAGFIERSNVNSVRSMVELIEATRAYEANQKAIWAQDETLGKAISEVGRVV